MKLERVASVAFFTAALAVSTELDGAIQRVP